MRNKKIYLVGTGVIVLAVLIVLLCVILPMTVHKNKMGSLLEAMASSKRISVGDPLFETGDILGNKGKEILLEGESLSEITAMLKELLRQGYRTNSTQKMSGGTLNMSVKARTDTNEVIILYFEETRFYYMDKETAVLFEAKDEAAYQVLFQKLKFCLTA